MDGSSRFRIDFRKLKINKNNIFNKWMDKVGLVSNIGNLI